MTFAAFGISSAGLLAQSSAVRTGQQAFDPYTSQQPGTLRHITLADLPQPMPETSVDNGPQIVPRPDGAWPKAPAGFTVTLYAGGDNSEKQFANHKAIEGPATAGTFREPRLMRTAPDGDVFLSDSAAGVVYVMHGMGADGRAAKVEAFATGLDHPFGIAFYPLGANPQWIYIANTTSVVRFPYKNGQMKAAADPETMVPVLPGYAQLRGGGHWTRDVVFTKDGAHMLVSVGSGSNVDDPDTHPREFHRADVLEYTPQGKFDKVYASGIRNCVGEAINPVTGALWCSTNERDGLGDNLVPDYISSVPEGSFFGWPWWYMGGHQDPRLPGTHPELKDKIRTPDIILQPHFASLELVFYPGAQKAEKEHDAFPSSYDGWGFAAEHGSWNRAPRAGYEVVALPMKNGKATGEFEDFLTGFVTPDGKVWGRPVGVAVMHDGSLLVSDDGSRSVWRVAHTGTSQASTGKLHTGNNPGQ